MDAWTKGLAGNNCAGSGRRGARLATPEERAYREEASDEQSASATATARPGQSPKGDGRRSQLGCIGGQNGAVMPGQALTWGLATELPPPAGVGTGHSVREQLDRLVAEMFDRGIRFEDARREFERRYIARALAQAKGNLSRAADLLGVHRNTLTRKVAEYRLDRRRPDPS